MPSPSYFCNWKTGKQKGLILITGKQKTFQLYPMVCALDSEKNENVKVRAQLATECLAYTQVTQAVQQKHLHSLEVQTIVLSDLGLISSHKVESWETVRKKNLPIDHIVSESWLHYSLWGESHGDFSRFNGKNLNLNALLKTRESIYSCILRLTKQLGSSILRETLQKSCFPRNAHISSLGVKMSVYYRLWADWHRFGP